MQNTYVPRGVQRLDKLLYLKDVAAQRDAFPGEAVNEDWPNSLVASRLQGTEIGTKDVSEDGPLAAHTVWKQVDTTG